jgi:hypothetical protein
MSYPWPFEPEFDDSKDSELAVSCSALTFLCQGVKWSKLFYCRLASASPKAIADCFHANRNSHKPKNVTPPIYSFIVALSPLC